MSLFATHIYSFIEQFMEYVIGKFPGIAYIEVAKGVLCGARVR